jgi:hypothetical protein
MADTWAARIHPVELYDMGDVKLPAGTTYTVVSRYRSATGTEWLRFTVNGAVYEAPCPRKEHTQ